MRAEPRPRFAQDLGGGGFPPSCADRRCLWKAGVSLGYEDEAGAPVSTLRISISPPNTLAGSVPLTSRVVPPSSDACFPWPVWLSPPGVQVLPPASAAQETASCARLSSQVPLPGELGLSAVPLCPLPVLSPLCRRDGHGARAACVLRRPLRPTPATSAAPSGTPRTNARKTCARHPSWSSY